MGIPSSLASFDLDIAHPSLLERTMTGFLFKEGSKTRSQETKKLLPSIIAKQEGGGFLEKPAE